jgi:NitT/TauT family transport system permease protein
LRKIIFPENSSRSGTSHWRIGPSSLAKSLCANRFETVVRVILPSILSHLVTGLRLAVGIAWIVLVRAEMLGVRAGLGYYILDARDRLSYSELMAVILIIGAIGYSLDTVLRLAQGAFSAEA